MEDEEYDPATDPWVVDIAQRITKALAGREWDLNSGVALSVVLETYRIVFADGYVINDEVNVVGGAEAASIVSLACTSPRQTWWKWRWAGPENNKLEEYQKVFDELFDALERSPDVRSVDTGEPYPMRDTLVLDDGRGWQTASSLFSELLRDAASEVPEDSQHLRRWLTERSEQRNGSMGFDVRSFAAEPRAIVLGALRRSAETLGPRSSHRRARKRMKRLVAMMDAVARGDPPRALNDLKGVVEFDGTSIEVKS